MSPPSDFQSQFEQLGEDGVRQNLVAGVYGGRRQEAAERWLSDRDRAAASAAMDEQIRLARSAKNAAWAAAMAAIAAAAMAAVSAIIAYFSLSSPSP